RLVRGEFRIVLAGHDGIDSALHKLRPDFVGDGQVNVLFQVTGAVLRSTVDPAVARIDQDGGLSKPAAGGNNPVQDGEEKKQAAQDGAENEDGEKLIFAEDDDNTHGKSSPPHHLMITNGYAVPTVLC